MCYMCYMNVLPVARVPLHMYSIRTCIHAHHTGISLKSWFIFMIHTLTRIHVHPYRYVHNTPSLYRYSLISHTCTGTLYWYPVLVPCTGTLYWSEYSTTLMSVVQVYSTGTGYRYRYRYCIVLYDWKKNFFENTRDETDYVYGVPLQRYIK